MKAGCLRYTSLPGASRLYSDFLYHFERVSRFYQRPYQDLASFRAAAAEVSYPLDRRRAIVAALSKRNPDSPALRKLAEPGTVAVVTGQQVGLFSGPAYTVYKALTAAKLAARLTGEGIPAVPVFWLATEDHDYAEIAAAWGFNAAHEPVKFEIADPTAPPGPVGPLVPPRYPVEELRTALAGFPFGAEAAALAEESYAPGRSLGEAFAHLLRRLLPGTDLILLDPLDPEIRSAAAPFLREAALAHEELIPALIERNGELERAGYHAQVHVEAKSSLFFLLEGGRRIALKRNQVPLDRPEALSPNALLRPVMQDYLLPTVAYVGGPAELAYLAQSEVIYRRLLGRFPVVAPRAGFTLLDARAVKLLDRYSLRIEDLFEGPLALRERIARTLTPPDLIAKFAAASEAIAAAAGTLDTGLKAFDPTLSAAFAKSRAKIAHQMRKTEAKVRREALRRDQRAQSEAAFLENSIYPLEHLQERFYGILPFLAQHGPGLTARIADQVCFDCPDHVILPV